MIRPFGLRDVRAIAHLQPRGVSFDLRRLLLCADTPTVSAVAGYLTHQRLGCLTCVQTGRDERGPTAYAQVGARADPVEWDLLHLAPSLDYRQDAVDLWRELLTHLVVLGAQRGIMRIYARVPEDAETELVLRQAGFTVVSREEVFVLTRKLGPAPLPRGLRLVGDEDLMALAELRRQVLPPLVLQAEGGMRSGKRAGGAWWRGHGVTEYIWSDKGKASAHLQVQRGTRGQWLQMIVLPECRADVLPCIRYALAQAQGAGAPSVYASVPDYAIGLAWLLRTLGFESFNRQTLMVVHTVSRVPVRRPILVPGLEPRVDAGSTIGHIRLRTRSARLRHLADQGGCR